MYSVVRIPREAPPFFRPARRLDRREEILIAGNTRIRPPGGSVSPEPPGR
jgi:hypothetical protein